jgi:hypothetical protein
MDQFLTVNIGQILQTLIIVITGFIALGAMRNEIRNQGERLKNVDVEIAKLRDVMVVLARQDERLTAMDQRMLSQGRRLDRSEERWTEHWNAHARLRINGKTARVQKQTENNGEE